MEPRTGNYYNTVNVMSFLSYVLFDLAIKRGIPQDRQVNLQKDVTDSRLKINYEFQSIFKLQLFTST